MPANPEENSIVPYGKALPDGGGVLVRSGQVGEGAGDTPEGKGVAAEEAWHNARENGRKERDVGWSDEKWERFVDLETYHNRIVVRLQAILGLYQEQKNHQLLEKVEDIYLSELPILISDIERELADANAVEQGVFQELLESASGLLIHLQGFLAREGDNLSAGEERAVEALEEFKSRLRALQRDVFTALAGEQDVDNDFLLDLASRYKELADDAIDVLGEGDQALFNVLGAIQKGILDLRARLDDRAREEIGSPVEGRDIVGTEGAGDDSEDTVMAEETPEERRHRIFIRMEELWSKINESDVPTKGATNPTLLSWKEELLDLASEIGSDEVKKWRIKLKIWDAALKVAGPDFIRELASPNASEMRSQVSGEVSIREMREYLRMEDVAEIVKEIEAIFFAGSVKYVDEHGNPLLNDDGEPMVDESGEPYTHNYARSGNPNDRDISNGRKLPLSDFLKRRLPEARDSDVTALIYVIILGELRHKAEAPYYALYAETPQTFDLTPIKQASLGYLLYKIRSANYVRKDFWRFFACISLPTMQTLGLSDGEVLRDGGLDKGQPYYLVDSETGEVVPRFAEIIGRSERVATESNLAAAPWEISYPPSEDQIQQLGLDPSTATEEDIRHALKKRFSPSKKDKNVRDAFRARKIYDQIISVARLPRAEIDSSLQYMPMIWDILRARPDSSLEELNYQKYAEIGEKWLAFIKKMKDAPKVSDEDDVSQAINEAINAYSPNKGMLGAIEDTPYAEFYYKLLQLIFLRYIKDLFDQCDQRENHKHWGTSETSRLNKFIKIARRAVNQPGTIPRFIQDYLIGVFDLVQRSNVTLFTQDDRRRFVEAGVVVEGATLREVALEYKKFMSGHRPFAIGLRVAHDPKYEPYRVFYATAADKERGDKEQ